MDYYKVLGIHPTGATIDDIAGAFRTLSVETHPLRHQKDGRQSEMLRKFDAICEAYEVLSDPELRATYDKHGEVGLKNGIPAKKSQQAKVQGSYVYSGNSIEIFKKFHGTKDPFADNFFITTKEQEARDKKALKEVGLPADIEVTVSCTIHEFFNGSLKELDYVRHVLWPDGKSV